MRIGIDMRLPAYRPGGIARYVEELVAALAALDDEDEYLLLHAPHDCPGRLPPEAPRFARFDVRTPCHHRLERLSLAAEISSLLLDVLHSPDVIPPRGGARRRVITVPDLSFLHFPEHHTRESLAHYRDQIAWAAGSADHILAISEHTRRDVIDRLGVPSGRVTVTPLAAARVFREAPDPAAVSGTLASLDLAPGFLLFVGTLEPRKNLPLLLEAHALLLRRGLKTPLVLAGRLGWLCDDILARIARADLAGHVRHVEGPGDERLAHLYAGAGLLALPSLLEGFGLPVLEAMHRGCPVVASDRGALPEVVGEAGLLLPPEDAGAWANALERVLVDESLRRSLAEAGRRRAAAFTWEETARRTRSVYRDAPSRA